jgi:hypothetical protein
MAEQAEQSYANHSKTVPGFHFLTLGLLTVNLIWSLYRLFRGFEPLPDRVISVLLALGVALLAYYARVFPLAVQDRLIRLEERMRLAELLPPDLRARIPELTRSQLVALRFASDAEVADLTRKVLAENITGRAEIKKLIKTWRPDHLRA